MNTDDSRNSYGKTDKNLLVIVDAFTDYKYIVSLNKKKWYWNSIGGFIKSYIKRQFNYKVNIFWTDKGTEFTPGNTLKLINKKDTKLSTTSGYSS